MSRRLRCPETFFTVWSNVFERAHLGAGENGAEETLLVQGGSSGIGVTAIQIAKALGHRVFVTAGTDEKCRACEALGAERAINYKTEDFVEVVKSLTNDRGVDVILDMVAGDYLPRELKALADGGRICVIALLGGAKAEINLNDVLRRRLSITGSTLRPRPVAFKGEDRGATERARLAGNRGGAHQTGDPSSFPAQHAAAAHTLMEGSTHVGKIVLDWGQVRRQARGESSRRFDRIRRDTVKSHVLRAIAGGAVSTSDVDRNHTKHTRAARPPSGETHVETTSETGSRNWKMHGRLAENGALLTEVAAGASPCRTACASVSASRARISRSRRRC